MQFKHQVGFQITPETHEALRELAALRQEKIGDMLSELVWKATYAEIGVGPDDMVEDTYAIKQLRALRK